MPISAKDDVTMELLSALLEDPTYRGVIANMLSMPEDVSLRSGWLPGKGVAGLFVESPTRVIPHQIRVDPRKPVDPKDTLAHELMHYMTTRYRGDPSIKDRTDDELHEFVYSFGSKGTAPSTRPIYGPREEVRPGREWRAKVVGEREIPRNPLFMEVIKALVGRAVAERHETTLEALK